MTHSHKKDWDLAEAKLRKARGEPTSMSIYKYSLGKKDCAAGKEPQHVNAYYIEGYAEQYEREQVADAQSREELK